MLDIREFEVKLENCETKNITENQISANLYYQLDNESREILKLKGIIDHKKDGDDLTKETGYTVIKGGHKKFNPTTHG